MKIKKPISLELFLSENSRNHDPEFSKIVDDDRATIIKQVGFAGNFVFFLIFAFFDYFYYPEFFSTMVVLRSVYLALCLYVILLVDINHSNVRFWGAVNFISNILALIGLMAITGNIASPYPIGMLVTIVLYGLLLRISIIESFLLSATAISIYWSGAFLFADKPLDIPLMVFLTSLLVLSASVVYIMSLHSTSRAYLAYILNKENEEKANAISLQHEELLKMDIAKTKLLAGISHEFRTPLTLILSPIDSMLSNLKDKTSLESYLKIAEKEGMRLLRLVNNLLTTITILEKGDSAQNSLNIKPINIRNLLIDQIDSFQMSAKAKGLDFIFDDQVFDDIYINADLDALDKIISNPIMNAVKYTFEGSVKVSIIKSYNKVTLNIIDTGIGMEFQNESDVFEPFITGTNATNSGTGLGLSLTKNLIDMLQGKMEIHPNSPRGTIITISFDIVSTKRDFKEVPIDSFTNLYNKANREIVVFQNNDDTHFNNNKKNIMVVDDEINMLGFLVSIFKQRFNVYSAENGKKALQIIKETNIDIAILDLMLPDIQGTELAEEIIKLTPSIKLIMLTANQAPIVRENALNGSIDAFFDKPFNKSKLLESVDNLLGIDRENEYIDNQSDELSVLIIEDNSDLAAMIAKNLPKGTIYTLSNNADSLSDLLENHDYDLITVDKDLQGINSHQILDRIFTGVNKKESVIVGISGSRLLDEVIPDFFQDIIYKPFTDNQLRNKLKLYLIISASRRRYLSKENQLIDQQELYIQQEKLATLGETILNIVHEINNPLNFSMQAIEALKDNLSAEPVDITDLKEIAEDIGVGLRQIHHSTKNLTSYGYNDAKTDKSFVYLDAVISSSCKMMYPEKSGVDIQVICGKFSVFGNENQLIQVFTNLIKNSMRSMINSDRKEIIITVKEAHANVDKIEISFLDYGHGVDESLAVKIFDPYFTSAEKGKGTGFGLNICRMIIEGHNGSMFFSGNNPGAEFRIILPKANE